MGVNICDLHGVVCHGVTLDSYIHLNRSPSDDNLRKVFGLDFDVDRYKLVELGERNITIYNNGNAVQLRLPLAGRLLDMALYEEVMGKAKCRERRVLMSEGAFEDL